MSEARYIKDYKYSKRPYILLENLDYHSHRYNKDITVFATNEDRSDGATFEKDIDSDGWWLHDKLKRTKRFNDGSYCSNWKASWILYDVLKSEGYWFRSRSWFISTLIYGEVSKLMRIK